MKVEVKGAAAKIDALFRFDKVVWAGIQKGVKEAAESVAADARSRIPAYGVRSSSGQGGWGRWIATADGDDLSYDQSKIRSGIKPRFRSQYKNGLRIVKGQAITTSPAAAIFMLAGSKNRSRHRFNTVINRQHGKSVWPRAMTPAFYAKGPQASRDIGALIEKAINDVNNA